jgi:hypothetical protein
MAEKRGGLNLTVVAGINGGLVPLLCAPALNASDPKKV